MDGQLPANLIFEDSSLTILFEEGATVNRTKSSIIIKGTKGGFLSLANAILFFSNDLMDTIHVHLLPFVSSNIVFSIRYDDSLNDIVYGTVLHIEEKQFIWKLSESEVCKVAAAIHSLGHINPEIHFDEGKAKNEITVYCVLQQ
jgi:hypothetical protein